MRSTIIYGSKADIQALNLHEVIAFLAADIMFMTDDLTSEFISKVLAVDYAYELKSSTLIVCTDPTLTLAKLHGIELDFPHVLLIEASRLNRPQRPFNMPSDAQPAKPVFVEPGGRGAAKRCIGYIGKANWLELKQAELRYQEFKKNWDVQTEALLKDTIPPTFDSQALVDTLERFAIDDPRLFGRATSLMTAEEQAGIDAYLEGVREAQQDAFSTIGPLFRRALKSESMLGAAASFPSSRLGATASFPSSRQQSMELAKAISSALADLEDVKKTLDTE